MIRTIIFRILQRRHFWRDATFGEVADLYISRMLRIAAVHIGTGFTSIFLYKAGYSLVFIMTFWSLIYLCRAIVAPIAGYMVSRIGTAHSTLISNIIYIPAMLALGFMPEFGLLAIIIFAVCMSVSGTIYVVSYYVEFSRVKNPLHAGKEIGFMNIVEKITLAFSPIIGGFIALQFGVQATMWVASILFALSAVPMFKINHQTETMQQFSISGFPWRMAIRSMIAKSSEGFDVVATSIVWGIFVVIFVFPNSDNNIYVIIGALSSVTIVVAIITSIMYGKIIDKNKGGNLLKYGSRANSLVHLTRIVAVTPIDVVGVNILNEAATTAQNMSFLRGLFDTADLSGHRIMYLVGSEVMSCLGAALACVVFIICEISIGELNGFRLFFVISAIAIQGFLTARFPIYRK